MTVRAPASGSGSASASASGPAAAGAAGAARQRILVVCATDWERTAVAAPQLQQQYEFIHCCDELYDSLGLQQALRFNVQRYLDGVSSAHRHRGIAGILGTGDYPGCIFGAYIAEGLGLPGPRTRDIVLLSHKFYSRQLQQRLVPEATPPFKVLHGRAAHREHGLGFPCFVKPIKGTMSIRAQMVHSAPELRRALRLTFNEQLRQWMLLRPFSQLLRSYFPQPVPAHAFIAEGPLRGQQVTVDGFVQGGRVTVMGIVDSIMYPGTMSFRRFEYPSSLPAAVQARMIDITTRVMEGSGFDNSCFNLELFYDAERDALSIIEINPRMSYQFSDLFERVDGKSSFAVQLQLATGQKVHWPRGSGADRVAASFVMRRFSDARVVAIPQAAALAEVERQVPGALIKILCAPGERLSDHDQDVGSYRYCIVNLAAPTREQLYARFARVEELLQFRFA
jgi:hypothetical protein